MKKTAKAIFTAFSSAMAALYFIICYYSVKMPDKWYNESGKNFKIDTFLPIQVENKSYDTESTFENNNNLSSDAEMKLFGVIPIKSININETGEKYLVPGGELYGLKIHIDGAVVTGMGNVESSSGNICPAEKGNIQTGDIIKTISGKSIKSSEDIENILSVSEGEPVSVCAERNGEEYTTSITPVFSESTNRYEIGMWVRDSTAGIGTVTFYDTENNIFGSLGHPVCDSDTGTFIPFGECETAGVKIKGIEKGSPGKAGAIKAEFTDEEGIGLISGNTDCGVYGSINIKYLPQKEKLPLGYKKEIHTGKAYIYCSVDENTAEKYDIEIKKINYNSKEKTKDMVIKVTDSRLLEKTGGIVCGMSGSPVIQDDKIIGAVTHVFVKNSSEGYAVFCENMLKEIKK
ncbi:MAG: SpoIVB peptidase [Oscillospiraceae bacterium]|nr:SpoIVB peptidase [Oscillospiraceae bacterium]MDD6085573.1 SpoIVB peptidase [Oscillospiraceae bacterium]MDY3257498.1 SpoIVB peptidase [Ruminococcus callidus]